MRPRRTSDFFSESEKAEINKAIHAAERSTSGEIVVIAVEESDPYPDATIVGPLLLSGFVALVISILIGVVDHASDWGHLPNTAMHFWELAPEIVGHITIWSYLPMLFVGFGLFWGLCKMYPRLKLAFLGRTRIETTVRQRAVRAFFEKGLYRTKDETGVLIFISLMERKVWILGDRGINEKIPEDFWRALATELASGIKENRAYEALRSVVARCGQELQKSFPIKADDVDELPDEVMTDGDPDLPTNRG